MRVVVVVGLKAGENQREPFVFDGGMDDARERQRIASSESVVVDVDGAIGAGRETGAERGARVFGAYCQSNDLFDFPGVLEREKLFQGVAIVVVDCIRQARRVHPSPFGIDAEHGVGVGDVLDENK